MANVTIGNGPGSFPLAGFVPAGGTLFERENAGDVNAYGVEGSAEHAFGPNFACASPMRRPTRGWTGAARRPS